MTEATGRPGRCARASRRDALDPPPEILVVGGGPAGSTVAGLLARRGRDVLVVDRATFPRPKPCGECLNPGAVAALDRLGLRDSVEALDPARLRGWSVGGRWSEAHADFGGGRHGLGVARARLDAALLEAARARGARLLQGARVEAVVADDGDGPRVELRQGGRIRTVRPRLVIGADGLRSRVARSLGLGPEDPGDAGGRISLTARVRWSGRRDPPIRGRLQVQDGVTVGLAPVGRSPEGALLGNLTVVLPAGRWGRAAGRDPDRLMLARLAEVLPAERVTVVDGPWSSGSFRRPVRRPWAPGVVLVGDAAGYFDPLTGQGIHRALRSAELAAEAVDRALESPDPRWEALASYGRRWSREVTPGRRVQRVVDAVMHASWLREPVLTLLGPRTLAPVIRVTGDLLPVSSLCRPSSWTPSPPEFPCIR